MGRLKEISDGFRHLLRNGHVKDAAFALGDAGAAKILAESVVETVPIVSLVNDIVNMPATISDQLLGAKIKAFLDNFEELSEERREIFDQIERDKKYRSRVSEQLIKILDQCDDEAKAEIIASLFSHLLESGESRETFLRAINVVQSVYIGELERIQSYWLQHRSMTKETVGALGATEMFQTGEIAHRMYDLTNVGLFVVCALADRPIRR